MSESVVVALARLISEIFPDLEKRAFAVSEVKINKERVPRLPACMVALQHETPQAKATKLDGQLTIDETVIVDFWLPPLAYAFDEDGAPVEGESVYYAFYPYDQIRDQLFAALAGWKTPQGVPLHYVKLELAADSFAVTITFTFKNIWNWCRPTPTPVELGEAKARKITFGCFHPIAHCIKPERKDNGARQREDR